MARRDRRNGRRQSGGVPPSWLGGWFDPELDDLFRNDPSLYETARMLHAARPEAEAEVHYRNRLRASLMEEAAGSLRRRRGVRSWLRIGPGHLAWSGAALGVVAIGATVLALFASRPQDRQVVLASSTLTAQHQVSPNDVITVAFNQPMNQSAVVAGLQIEPATQVTTAWQGNNLVITPVHHLTGNTPYTVTITKPALVSAAGSTAAAPVQITFGTAPTPPSGPSSAPPPALTPSVLGAAASGSAVLFAPDGSVVTSAGLPVATGGTSSPPPAPTPVITPFGRVTTPSAPPSATPTVNVAPTPTAASSPAPGATGPSLLAYPSAGGSVVLGPAASAVAYAPGGGTIAFAEPDTHGGSLIVVALADGSKPVVLTDSATPVATMTWASNDRVIYAAADLVQAVDLAGATSLVAAHPGGGTIGLLAPGGGYAYLAPAGGSAGQLWDISGTATHDLSGGGAGAAFSGDGQTIAWVDQSGPKPKLITEAVNRNAPATVSTLDPGAAITSLALNHDGTEAAYVTTSTAGATELVVAQVPSGTTLATGPAAGEIAFAPDGSRIALLQDGLSGPVVAVAALPGPSSVPPSTLLPTAASTALHAFVDAQVRGDVATLSTLSGNGVNAGATTPHGLSRGYVIEATTETDGSVTAAVELLVDPTTTHSVASVATERLTLTASGAAGAFVVTALDASALRDQATGPHVVHVTAAPGAGGYLVQVNFDSDLNPATLAGAITVVSASGATLTGTVRYDADTRSATVTLTEAPTGPVTVTVATGLRDVNGQALATTFITRAGSTAR